ncbi:hypothetical protein [Acidovorax sp. NCPPB 3576]|uniref:hypothetical protein n=1 Tax=Acidovorax sp. NCPPB 3576 TaxID=2940488 RepID=UPI00234A872E|nr:hypothetical protein [Acidovorax sp. NCPPB 3576]WCM89497.1 hypothetical protein M5C98_05470 [Acidovorax sp. NCPPB 3576]
MVIFMSAAWTNLKKPVFLLLLAGILVGAWYAFTPKLFHTSISPRKVYRVEYYEASPIQSLIHFNFKMPAFVRLYRNQPETLLGESDVVELWMNGSLNWWFDDPVNSVVIGNDIVFENVAPECRECPSLPDTVLMP